MSNELGFIDDLLDGLLELSSDAGVATANNSDLPERADWQGLVCRSPRLVEQKLQAHREQLAVQDGFNQENVGRHDWLLPLANARCRTQQSNGDERNAQR